jgi:UDP-N-acetylmuramoyl-tripeptide--D-alanyl-D-alanine ligase
MLTLADVLEALTGTRIERASMIISEAAIDSRQVIPASMFVALPGERSDGHTFVGDVFKRGAHLALVEKDLSQSYHQIDLRSGSLPETFTVPEAPFCLLVNNTLQAMQKIAKFWRLKNKVRVIGITGSVGKSTTKELVTEVLSQRYRTL